MSPDVAIALWHMCQVDDDTIAEQVKQEAIAAGATDLDVARAWRMRAERIAGQVFVIYTGAP